ncbi:Uncharacterised protein [Yersinia kristensenii]|nr:Uncharacterised protein [Yersinia kristensenii]
MSFIVKKQNLLSFMTHPFSRHTAQIDKVLGKIAPK